MHISEADQGVFKASRQNVTENEGIAYQSFVYKETIRCDTVKLFKLSQTEVKLK